MIDLHYFMFLAQSKCNETNKKYKFSAGIQIRNAYLVLSLLFFQVMIVYWNILIYVIQTQQETAELNSFNILSTVGYHAFHISFLNAILLE